MLVSVEIAALSLPLLNNRGIGILLVLNAASVLKLSQLGCSFFEHLLLDDTALLTIAFVDLFQDISLVILLSNCITHLLVFILGVSFCNLLFNKLFFVLQAPLLFVGLHLSRTDSLSPILIDLLHQVDTSLILLLPLILLDFPLLLRL
jgi:hypothetical protein